MIVILQSLQCNVDDILIIITIIAKIVFNEKNYLLFCLWGSRCWGGLHKECHCNTMCA